MMEREIFDQALGISDPEERSAFLDQQCGVDTETRHQVERMLGVQSELGNFLENPAVDGFNLDLLAGQETPHDSSATWTMPLLGEMALEFLQPSDDSKSLGRIGPYEILEIVGRGGMGIVLKGHDTRLKRIVAVKVLAPELASNATARARFSKETEAAAAISHDHVVTIHGVGEFNILGEKNLPYLVMEFIDGLSLQERIDRDGPLELREILRIGHQVAAGLSAAHRQGLIHRDVKPSNILLQNGVQRVKVTDFGLARAVDDVAITRTGEVAGTPQYMSPEQAQGHAVDPRSDLFSLGSVLYAMCTGRGPFRADSTVAALRRVCDDTPRPIRDVNPDIPIWLVDVIDSLLEKNPEDRIQSAEEVSDLLAKCLAQLNEVGSNSVTEIVVPHKKRHAKKTSARQSSRRVWLVPVMSLLAIGLLFSVTEATGVTHVASTVIRLATGEGTLVIEVDDPAVQVSLDGEELSITGAGIQELKLRPGNHQVTATKDGQQIRQQVVSIQRGGRQVVRVTRESAMSSEESKGLIGRFVEKADDFKVVPPSAIHLVRRLHRDEDVWLGPVEFTPDGRHLLCASGRPELWSLETGNAIELSSLARGGCTAIANSPDGKYVATGYYQDSTIHLWDLTTGSNIGKFTGIGKQVFDLAFSPDGRFLLSTSNETTTAHLWDVATAEEVWRLKCDRYPSSVAFSPSGETALICDYNVLRIVDVKSGKEIRKTEKINNVFFCVNVSPDGRLFVTGREDGAIQFFDAESGKGVGLIPGHRRRVRSIGFTSDGCHVISGSEDKTLRIWNVETRTEVARIEAENHFVNYFALSPDGRSIATGGGHFSVGLKKYDRDGDYDIRLWRLPESVWPDEAAVKPFVILNHNGGELARYATLADAVVGSGPGDTIEIRGSGPFVSDQIELPHRLTIRAASGFRPVLRTSVNRTTAFVGRLFSTNSVLVLEGLELDNHGQMRDELTTLIYAGAPIFVTNCRIHCEKWSQGIGAEGSVTIANSLVIADDGATLGWWPKTKKPTCFADNCIFVGRTNVSSGQIEDQLEPSLASFSHCTFVTRGSTTLGVCLTDHQPSIQNGQVLITLQIYASVFDADYNLTDIVYEKKHTRPFAGDDLVTRVRQWFPRESSYNLYRSGVDILWITNGSRDFLSHLKVPGDDQLAKWREFLGRTESGSISGTIGYAGGSLRHRAASEPQKLTPADFRLRPDSAGYQAGPDGKDLGADVDLVGPGKAYEKWKQSPNHHDWLKRIQNAITGS